jgi:flagellar biosynthesis anti-sigma factor FlgM
MKIHGDNSSALTGAADQIGKTADQGSAPAPRSSAAAARADQVTLSPEAKFMQTLTEQAGKAPEVRQEVVDRMRALLNEGAIGNDADKLADSIIDDWTKLP